MALDDLLVTVLVLVLIALFVYMRYMHKSMGEVITELKEALQGETTEVVSLR